MIKNNQQQYPEWIDEFARSFHHAFKKMVPTSWGPVDGWALLSHLNGSFIRKLHQSVKKVKEKETSIKEVAESFSCPSTLRLALYFLALEYQFQSDKDKKQFKEIIEFFIDVLKEMIREDIFAYDRNITHTSEEIKNIVNSTPWIKADIPMAKEVGKLYSSLASLVYAEYRDFFPQDAHDIYGPYDVSSKFGNEAILLIKHFIKIHPKEIWPDLKSSYDDVKIFQVLKHVKFSCEVIGMHSLYEGDIVRNTVALAVRINNKFVDDIREVGRAHEEIARIATDHSRVYGDMSEAEVKLKFLEWLCYQFFGFFRIANVDWRPTQEMMRSVKDKQIPNRCEIKEFPSWEEYRSSKNFEIFWLKDLYHNSH